MALPIVSAFDPLWTDFVNTEAGAANALVCTDTMPSDWDGGAGSVQSLRGTEDGYVQFTARENGFPVSVGLTNGNPDHSPTSIQYAWYVDGAGNCQAVDHGSDVVYTGTYSDGDLMQVVWQSGFIHYYKNGTALAIAGFEPLFPLVLDASIQDAGGSVEGALICADVLGTLRPAPPYYGQGYPGNRNQPSNLRFVAAIGPSLELTDITNPEFGYVDRQSVRIEKSNQDGANAKLSFNLILPERNFADIPANRYISVDDPTTPNGLGGALGYFAGFTMQPSSAEPDGSERVLTVECVDFGILLTKPPKQITTQWPPGDGTPVVNTTASVSISPGVNTITPKSMRHIFVGKKLIVQNSDGGNRETVVVTAVTDTTFDATFTTSKTASIATVPGSLHVTGLQTVTPDDMTNITVGSGLWCQKHHGDQTTGNEEVAVVAVTSTTFDAVFQYKKTHDWTVANEWYILGGISDKELIADGFSMSIDTIDPTTGDISTSIVAIPSLLDFCFNNEGFSVDKSGVDEIIASLPHGSWTGASPADVLKWVTQQNDDDTKQPRYNMSFVQPTAPTLTTLTPKLRYYDAKSTAHTAPIALTNRVGKLDLLGEARWSEGYTYEESGQPFANKQTVLGDLDAEGSWQDDDSISNPTAPNYVGRVIENSVVTDQNVTTDDDAAARASDLAAQQQLSTRQKVATLTTLAQLDPLVLYEPQIVEWSSEFEPDGVLDLEVRSVTLSFPNDLATYAFQLGTPQNPARFYEQGQPALYREAAVKVGRGGKVTSVGPQTTRYISTHAQLQGDATLYVADTSDAAIKLYLPRASYSPGQPVRVKVPSGAANNATLYAFQRDGVIDTIDGANSVDIAPGQGVILQSAGEHDVRGHGALWHVVGNITDPSGTPWLVGGNAQGADASFGSQDAFDVPLIANNVEQARITPEGLSITTALRMTGLAATPTAPDSGYIDLYPWTDGAMYFETPDGIEHPLAAAAGGGFGRGLIDRFNRADAASLGTADSHQAWLAVLGAVAVAGNEASVSTLDGTANLAATLAPTAAPDAYTVAKFSSSSSGQRLFFRCFPSGGDLEGLFIESTGSSYKLRSRAAGTDSDEHDYSADDIPPVAAGGDIVGVAYKGSDIRLFVNGQEYDAVSLGTYANNEYIGVGQAGMAGGTFDNILCLPDTFPILAKMNYVLAVPDTLPNVLDALDAVAGTVRAWYLYSDVPGDIEVDVQVNGVSIVGASPPAISAGDAANGIPDENWTPVVLADGDVVGFVINSVSTITKARVVLDVDRAMPV